MYNISFKLVNSSANALYYRVKTSKGKQKCRNSCRLFLWGMFFYCLTTPFSQIITLKIHLNSNKTVIPPDNNQEIKS